MEKRLITVEKAKSGRAKCRRCASKIEKGETRVGVKGWIAGRQAIMWQKPDCFSKGMEFAKAKSSRGKCKITGEQFTKGEDQLVFTVHNSRIAIKLSAVGSALEEVQSITTIKLEDVEGFENLEESSVSVLNNSFSGGGGSSSNTKKRPVEEDPVQEEKTPKKKKAKKASASKKIPVTEREILKRAESLSQGFKIVSWNVDGLRAPFRLEGLKKIAQDESPDLIVIQETMRIAIGLHPRMHSSRHPLALQNRAQQCGRFSSLDRSYGCFECLEHAKLATPQTRPCAWRPHHQWPNHRSKTSRAMWLWTLVFGPIESNNSQGTCSNLPR